MKAAQTTISDDRSLTVREAARTGAPDHYITALLAPAELRDDLITLAAFWGETGRIALTVGDDMLGEIRLQWWSDALAPGTEATGHPIADAMQVLIRARGLDIAVVEALVAARVEELGRLPFATEAEFDHYLDAAEGGLLRLSVAVRGYHGDRGDALIQAAARALGRVRVGLDLPYFAARSRLPLWPGALGFEGASTEGTARTSQEGAHALGVLIKGARSANADVKRLAIGCDRRLIDAVLPVALLEPHLRALETKERDPLRDVASISPLNRIVRLAWAQLRGRISGTSRRE